MPQTFDLHRGAVQMDPSNKLMSHEDTVRLLVAHTPTPVRLEPGDATRYDLLVWLLDARTAAALHYSPMEQYFLVTRFVGGDPVGSAIVRAHVPLPHEVVPIANENEWSLTLLHWYLTFLGDAVGLVEVE